MARDVRVEFDKVLHKVLKLGFYLRIKIHREFLTAIITLNGTASHTLLCTHTLCLNLYSMFLNMNNAEHILDTRFCY